MKRQWLAGLCAALILLLPRGALAASPAAQAAGTWIVAPKTKTVNCRLPAAVFKAKPVIKILPDNRGSLSFNVKKKGRKKRQTYKGRLAFKQKGHVTVTSKALKYCTRHSVDGRYKLSRHRSRLTLSGAGGKIVLIRKTSNHSNHSEK